MMPLRLVLLLALSVDQGLIQLAVLNHNESRIFLVKTVQCYSDLLLVTFILCPHCAGNDRCREFDRPQNNWE